MTRTAHFIILGGIAATMVATVYILCGDALGGEPTSSPPAAPHTAGPVANPGGHALRAELTAVRGAVQQLARTQASMQQEIDRAAAARSAAAATREQAAEVARAESEESGAADREASELAARCDAKIPSEAVDQTWSRAKSEQFTAFFARPSLAGTTVKAMDCRTTICRIDLAHRNRDDRMQFVQSFSDLAGPTGMVFAHIEADDDLDIVVYVTRDGVVLP